MATPYPSDTKYSMASASDVGQDIEKPPPYQFETPIQPQGYPPQNPPQQGYLGAPQNPPQQGYPPQTPPQQGYPPQQTQVSQQTVVVTQQPVGTTTRVYHSDQTNHSGIATAALVLSIITCFFCGGSLLLLICVLPALLLAVTALGQKGQEQRKNAQVSIGLSIAAIVTTVILIAVIVGINVTNRSYYYYY